MTTYFCMRHGLTEWNRDKRIQGNSDVDLCDEGRDMARGWGESLKELPLDCILHSGLSRARETAEIINEALGGLPMHVDPRLAEQDWGEWTGMTKDEFKEIKRKVRAQEKKGFGFCPPGGEDRESVLLRTCDALIDFSDGQPDAKVLVVTHQGVLKCLAYALSGLEFMPGDPLPIEPYKLHCFECMDNELAPGGFNMEI